MEFVPVNHAVGFQTLVRPRYHGRTSLPPSIHPVLETSLALHCRIPRPESQLCNPSAMRAAPKALTWLNRHGLWSLPPSVFLLPECSPGTSLKTAPRSHALTRNSWARFPEIPHDQLTTSAGVCLCPSPSPRNHFPGPIPQKPRPARRTPQSIICGAGPKSQMRLSRRGRGRAPSPNLFHRKLGPALHFLYTMRHIPVLRPVNHGAGVFHRPSSFPMDLVRDSLFYSPPRTST